MTNTKIISETERKKMKRRNMKNYIVEIFDDAYGEQLYITNPSGVQIYAHRVMKGEGLERAKAVIAQQ